MTTLTLMLLWRQVMDTRVLFVLLALAFAGGYVFRAWRESRRG